MKKDVRLLFITRKFPPSVGGMQKVSYALSQELSKRIPTTTIAWGGSQIWLPYFLIKTFLQALFVIPSRKVTNIHLGDGLLAPLGLLLKILTRRKVTVTVHGLDITYKNSLYQTIVPFCLRKLDKIICISLATQAECIKRGIAANKCLVIPWGVYPDEFKIKATRTDLEKIAGMNLKNKKVLITVGRLVKRKGVEWFINNVMPGLEDQYVYLIAGKGPERSNIENAIQKRKLKDRVRLLGKVSDHNLKVLYNTADLFMMPNIKVKGDMEGFGIVAVEASSTGLPVVASDLEGIKDAVIHKKTGLLLKSGAVSAFKKGLTTLRLSKLDVQKSATFYTWTNVANRYAKSLE